LGAVNKGSLSGVTAVVALTAICNIYNILGALLAALVFPRPGRISRISIAISPGKRTIIHMNVRRPRAANIQRHVICRYEGDASALGKHGPLLLDLSAPRVEGE
jgi:hypothetical protein